MKTPVLAFSLSLGSVFLLRWFTWPGLHEKKESLLQMENTTLEEFLLPQTGPYPGGVRGPKDVLSQVCPPTLSHNPVLIAAKPDLVQMRPNKPRKSL